MVFDVLNVCNLKVFLIERASSIHKFLCSYLLAYFVCLYIVLSRNVLSVLTLKS